MTSSFGTLNTAYTGLVAARQGLAVVGDNITNATTAGYTRQEVNTTSITPAVEGKIAPTIQVGGGVSINSVTRVDNPVLDAQVRTSSASDGYATEQSGAMNTIEAALNEPGTNGLSTSLQAFWTAWQNVANQSNTAASASLVIAAGTQVAGQLAAGYNAASSQWAATRSSMNQTVTTINQVASQIAVLNGQIRTAVGAGNNANALMDQENQLATTISNLSGATVRGNADGSMDVLLGGNALVSGTTAHTVAVTGSTDMAGATTAPVSIIFTDNPAATTGVTSGVLGADLALLAPSNASGTGGAIAQAAASYSSIATTLASTVNAIHETGSTASGTTGLDFFALDASKPAALGLSVIPTDSSGIASATPGAGSANGDVADKIAALTTSTTGADSAWSRFVVSVGSATSSATTYAATTSAASATAVTNQQAESSVDTDQETTNMLTYQHSFESAARVMTTIDSMLNTLINKTGLVGL
jgi:flagellar hook-associated protein 1 FlgK